MYGMVYKTFGGIVALVAAVVLLTSPAVADHNVPKAAKAIKGSIVTAYEPCTAPDTTTDSDKGSLPACTPVRSDSCGFSTINGEPRGKGQLQIKSLDDRGWSVKLKLLGLDQEAACEGQTMTFVVTYRPTAHNCVDAACTAVDQTVSLASCIVARGVCKINAPVHVLPDILAPGVDELLGFSVIHQQTGNRAFNIGVMSRDMM